MTKLLIVWTFLVLCMSTAQPMLAFGAAGALGGVSGLAGAGGTGASAGTGGIGGVAGQTAIRRRDVRVLVRGFDYLLFWGLALMLLGSAEVVGLSFKRPKRRRSPIRCEI